MSEDSPSTSSGSRSQRSEVRKEPRQVGISLRSTERKKEMKVQRKRTSNIQRSTLNIECGAASRAISVDPSATSRLVGTPVGMTEGVCEDCEHSVPAGSASQPTLICKHKAGAELPWQVVEANGACCNFERSRELVAIDIAAALAEGAKLIPLTQGKFAIVDAEDYERLSKYKWHVDKGDSTYYAARGIVGKNFRMHREILNAPEGLVVDHRNHNGLDNRRENLRLCTVAENNMNRRPSKRANKSSRFKCVSWDKRRKRYQAYIQQNGKTVRIGRFKSEVAAAKAYDEKAKELFGEFAYLNFPAEGREEN